MALRLTPFERYMVAEDRAAYPMSFEFWLSCEGSVDRELLAKAYERVIRCHPLTCAVLRKGVFRSSWTWNDDLKKTLVWHDDELSCRESLYRSPDIESGVGVELHGVRSDAATKLFFNFHHAVCDGLGAMQFINGVMSEYDYLWRSDHETGDQEAHTGHLSVQEPSDSTFETAQERLKGRNEFVIPAPVKLTRKQAISGMTRELCKVIFRRPKAIPAVHRSPSNDERQENVRLVSLAEDTTKKLGEVARAQGSTLNDLIVRDWLLTLRGWFQVKSPATTSGWLRVLVPTNLRDPSMSDISAANILGYAMVTRRLGECDSEAELLSSISADMSAVRDWGLGALFVTGLGFVDAIPGLLWLICRCSRRFSTSLLSNLGNVSRHFDEQLNLKGGTIQAGNLNINRISAIPPVRPGTRVSMVVARYQGQLDFSIRYDARWFDEDSIRDLVDRFTSQLNKSRGLAEASVPGEPRNQSDENGLGRSQQPIGSPRGVIDS